MKGYNYGYRIKKYSLLIAEKCILETQFQKSRALFNEHEIFKQSKDIFYAFSIAFALNVKSQTTEQSTYGKKDAEMLPLENFGRFKKR